MADALRLTCVDRTVEIRSEPGRVLDFLSANFHAMRHGSGTPDRVYEIQARTGAHLRLTRLESQFDVYAPDLGTLLYLLESDLVVQLQLLRPDLLFLHAAALERDGRAYLLVGRSGAGKSTTCWGLLRRGFRYLSDEMAPLALSGIRVLGYPHALCMKRAPPSGFEVPGSALRTSRGLHVPLPESLVHPPDDPLPVAAVFLVEYDPAAPEPSARALSPAGTAARLYPQILNALAHEADGLAAAASLARQVPGILLQAAELGATCRLIDQCIEDLTFG